MLLAKGISMAVQKLTEYLDGQNFVPIGRVIEGMAVVDSLQWPYIEKADHHMLATIGNSARTK